MYALYRAGVCVGGYTESSPSICEYNSSNSLKPKGNHLLLILYNIFLSQVDASIQVISLRKSNKSTAN